MDHRKLSVVALLALALAAACGGGDSGPELDASATIACSRFADVAKDLSAGILNDAELRDELKDIHDDAQHSETAGVASSAQSMLAAMTAGQEGNLASSFQAMTYACGGQVTQVSGTRMYGVSFSSCAEAKRLGAAPMAKDHPDYRGYLDRDGNGVACDE